MSGPSRGLFEARSPGADVTCKDEYTKAKNLISLPNAVEFRRDFLTANLLIQARLND